MSSPVRISDLKLRPPLEIMAEVAMLNRMAEGFDTEDETQAIAVAAGAHDALRWALGLAEEAPSDALAGDNAPEVHPG